MRHLQHLVHRAMRPGDDAERQRPEGDLNHSRWLMAFVVAQSIPASLARGPAKWRPAPSPASAISPTTGAAWASANAWAPRRHAGPQRPPRQLDVPRSPVARSHLGHPCQGHNPGREEKSADNKLEVKWVRMALLSASDSGCAPK